MTDRDTYIRQIVDRAPPLTPEQRDKLAILLRLETKESRGQAGRYDPVTSQEQADIPKGSQP